MDSYIKTRDGWDVDARPSSSTQRRRSQSPTNRYPRDHASDSRPDRDRDHTRRDRRDYDAPPQILPRKPSDSSASIPTGPASTHGSGGRNALPDKSVSSSAGRNSAAVETRAELLRRLLAAPVERSLFDQIEAKRYSIGKIRQNLLDEMKRIGDCQKYLDSGRTDHRDAYLPKLRGFQEKKAQFERQIKADNDELYRMQLEWQIAISEQCIPSLVAAAQAPIEHRLDDLRSEMRSDRAQDYERLEAIETRARQAAGTAERSQSDIAKIKREVGNNGRDLDRLTTLINSTVKELRRDIDKDVIQISDNDKRIKLVTQDLASLKAQVGKTTSAAVSSASRANSVAPPSPGNATRHRAPSPVRDLRRPPQAPTANANDNASTSTSNAATAPATDGDSTANVAKAAPTTTPDQQLVTRPILAKWVREFNQDLELRLDEIKDLAVQEATAENQACMEERLTAMLQKYKRRAGKDGAQDAQPGSVDGATDAITSAPRSMEIGSEPAGASDARTGTQPSQATEAPKVPEQPSDSTDVDMVDAIAQPASAAQPVANNVPSASASTTAAVTNHLDSVQPKTVSESAGPEGGKTKVVTLPASVVESIRIMLKTQASEIETIKKNQEDALAQLLASPEKLDQLFSLFKQHGLGKILESVAVAVPQLQASVNKLETALTTLLASRLDDRVKVLEDHKTEMIELTTGKIDWVQRQLEVLDDQSSLQGALLVKLSEHANPRRAPPSQQPTQQQQQQAHQSRSPVVQQLANPSAHALMRQQAGSPPTVLQQPPQPYANRPTLVQQLISPPAHTLLHPQPVSPHTVPQQQMVQQHHRQIAQPQQAQLQQQQRQAQAQYMRTPPYPGQAPHQTRGF